MRNLLVFISLCFLLVSCDDESMKELESIQFPLENNSWELMQANGNPIFEDETTLFKFKGKNVGEMIYLDGEGGRDTDDFSYILNGLELFIDFPSERAKDITVLFSDEFTEDKLYIDMFIIEDQFTLNDVIFKKEL